MNFINEEFDFDAVSHPINGDTLATVDAVARGSVLDGDWDRFVKACEQAAMWHDGEVDPTHVREHLTVAGELVVRPRRLSAFYNRAAGKSGFLDFARWGVNADTKGRNAGRPARIYRLRVAA